MRGKKKILPQHKGQQLARKVGDMPHNRYGLNTGRDKKIRWLLSLNFDFIQLKRKNKSGKIQRCI